MWLASPTSSFGAPVQILHAPRSDVGTANANGGVDNVTVILAQYQPN